MAKREVIGCGSVWERDVTFHDLCGLFKWHLEIKQAGGKVYWDMLEKSGDGGGWYDGWYSLSSTIIASASDWPCDDSPEPTGKRILILCVTTAKGQNAGVSVTGSASGSAGPSGPSGGGGLSVTYAPGYTGQILEWQVKLEACPGEEGCPSVSVLSNTAKVSDSSYFWGDILYDNGRHEDSAVDPHKPQLGIGKCNETLSLDQQQVLPFFGPPSDVHTAN